MGTKLNLDSSKHNKYNILVIYGIVLEKRNLNDLSYKIINAGLNIHLNCLSHVFP